MSEACLTDDELRDFIGYVQPARQARWLQENGFRAGRDFFLNAQGKVRLPREVIAHRGGARITPKSEPDFSKIRQTR